MIINIAEMIRAVIFRCLYDFKSTLNLQTNGVIFHNAPVTAARPVPIILDPFRSHPKLICRYQPTLCHNIA